MLMLRPVPCLGRAGHGAQAGAWSMPLTHPMAVLGRAADQKQRLWQNLKDEVTNNNRL